MTGEASLKNSETFYVTAIYAKMLKMARGLIVHEVFTLCHHSLVAFPYSFDWQGFRRNDFRANTEFIRNLSRHLDRVCFNFIRYHQCPIFANGDPIHSLPRKAGQIDTNHMMAGALLYNHSIREGRIIGGYAFTHFITRG